MLSVLTAAIDLVLPRTCVGCAADGAALCAGCRDAAGAGCATRRTGGLSIRAAGRYDGPLQAAVVAYKEHGRTDLARPLAALLVVALDASPPGVLVPVPTSAAARRRRGRDHLQPLVRRAAARTGREFAEALRLDRPVLDSVGLSATDRRRNLAGAMHALAPPDPARAECVVIDDVVTTGATLGEAVRALRAAGWRPQAAAVVATVPDPASAMAP